MLRPLPALPVAKYDVPAMSWRKINLSALSLILALAILTACQSRRAPAPKDGRYPLQGAIVSVDQARGQVTVKHGAIPGLMPAMTMVYDLRDPAQVKRLWPGDHIKADLVVQSGKADLENVTVQGK
jgi:Cu/Ag efflux protein CusF